MELSIPPKEEIFLRFDVRDIRKTKLQGILPENLIALEQTRPPVEKAEINRIVLLTYKVSAGRIGFEARIQGITADYRVLLNRLNDPAPCDLRFWPRIRLDLLPSVRAFYGESEVQVVDISGGGTHIILQKNDCNAPEIGQTVKLKFIFEKGEVTVAGKILRQWRDSGKRDHVAIEFCGKHNISQFIY